MFAYPRISLFGLALLLAGGSLAQTPSDISVRFGGTAQFRAGYHHNDAQDQDRTGFGLRRIRFRTTVGVGPNWTFFGQAEGAAASVSLTDLRIGYRFSPNLIVWGGRFVMAQPASFAITLNYEIDAIDRSAGAVYWAGKTLGADGRDFGVEARYTQPTYEARLAVHNGDGSWDRNRGNFREEIAMGSPTGVERKALATSGSFTWKPANLQGFETGVYGSYNAAQSPLSNRNNTGRTYTSYSAHAYYGRQPGSQPVRVKADLLGIRYEALPAETNGEHGMGVHLFGAYAVENGIELYARAERLWTDVHRVSTDVTFVGMGVVVSPSARRGRPFSQERLTLGFTGRSVPGDTKLDAYGIMAQMQLNF